jgi:hypothetical protein
MESFYYPPHTATQGVGTESNPSLFSLDKDATFACDWRNDVTVNIYNAAFWHVYMIKCK